MRYGSCFNEEDLVGKIVAITKGSMHGSSVSKRLLQRWLLQLNASLAEGEKTSVGRGRLPGLGLFLGTGCDLQIFFQLFMYNKFPD